jgi:hypothetical protein
MADARIAATSGNSRRPTSAIAWVATVASKITPFGRNRDAARRPRLRSASGMNHSHSPMPRANQTRAAPCHSGAASMVTRAITALPATQVPMAKLSISGPVCRARALVPAISRRAASTAATAVRTIASGACQAPPPGNRPSAATAKIPTAMIGAPTAVGGALPVADRSSGIDPLFLVSRH